MEDILKNFSSRNLGVLEYYYGITLELFRSVKDTHTDVYGRAAGNKTTKMKEFKGILISDDFFTSGGAYAGNFEEGFLYTREQGIFVADIIRVLSSDGKQRRFKIIEKETIGTQDSVFERWKISNLGD